MNRKGFTLIEMLIVVAIIGILASVVIVGLGPAQKRGRDSRRAADLREVQTGLELYYSKNGKYPVSGTDVTDWPSLQSFLKNASLGVTTVPDDPTTTRHYQYVSDAGGTTYVLGATLDDVNSSLLTQSLKDNPIAGGFSCGSPTYCLSL